MAVQATIQIKVNERLYLRDPENTELGRKIINSSIKLIEQIGFENFTFKKLANEINSTEASIYRYFENKHKLLIYLVSWYWSWLEYQVRYQIHNIDDPLQKLKIAIRVLSDTIQFDPNFSHINEELLHKIVIAESDKTYLTKEVDADNKEGFFISYKSLCSYVAKLVSDVNPDFNYPRSLISTVIEASHQQRFFSEHLPSLTDIRAKEGSSSQVADFLEFMVLKLIE
jgi:AcrR family transcriptional regulator